MMHLIFEATLRKLMRRNEGAGMISGIYTLGTEILTTCTMTEQGRDAIVHCVRETVSRIAHEYEVKLPDVELPQPEITAYAPSAKVIPFRRPQCTRTETW